MASEQPEAKIKGAAVQDFYTWYAREFGEGRMIVVWNALSPAIVKEVGASYAQLLPFHWYRASAIHALMDETLRGFDDAERERIAREGARVVVAQTLRGLYRAIFKTLVSPSRYLRNANTVWKSFHDTGHLETWELGPTHHRSELIGWRAHHPFIERLNGYAGKEIYEAMGCQGVTFEQSRGRDRDGNWTYITETRWRS